MPRPRGGERTAMVIGAFRATGRRSGAIYRANALYHRLDSPSPPCSARALRASSRQTKPRPIRLWLEIVADRGSTARNRHRAPNRPKRQTVARSCRAPTARRRPRHRAKCANAANVRFKCTQTAQALEITWIDYFGASSSRCSAARLRGRSRRVRSVRGKCILAIEALRPIDTFRQALSDLGGSFQR